MFELSFIWAGVIAFAVLTYVILDGFDLGVGILFRTAKTERERSTMMNSIAPIWDGNETWLVLGGGGLFAVFPLAYAVIMPALYMPIILMLLALIFRGVAFEYRWRTERWKPVWDWAFFGGSVTAAFMQGIALGALVQGIEVTDRAYSGGWWDWLTGFSILTGVAVVVGYALLGATWIILKTEDKLQQRMQGFSVWLGIGTLAFIALVSILTPFQNPDYFQRWFNLPGSALSIVMPLAVISCAWALFSGLKAGKDLQPFLAALMLFVLCFIGIGISFYPNIVPPSLTIVEAAAPDESLLFALVGTVVLVPIILAYTAYAYWVFRGKIDPDEGYH
ncbi:cytochrome bd-I ubiquinol oxidase subunit 2 apoprotein [Pacificibacter maritimus]|uniref:Cytochrome bd-I ubiquinol oxidase subunit 2 apoprotein n=1 Tax=Pacificibacter maritimus TaxID=762213 RepID=A0A3N4UVY3_9RHOB|nr:cytochrome d ubiquinol oxidase subunit II [Pacificibacter maritimus]RPE71681.1 cytochrome bd-I ubiquinol oxidase subunit 2 apoprotein [Pacificibacter maritimus]